MILKKVINKYKFDRVKNNPRTYYCNSFRTLDKVCKQDFASFLLDDHLYIAHPKGVFPHTKYEYYAYYIGEVGGVHYRKDKVCFYKIELSNPNS